MKKLLGLLLAMGFFASCGDDDGLVGEVVPPRLLAEVAPEDDAEILEFLSTHFYNYEDFQEPIAPDFDFKIRIDTIAGENADKTPLSEQVSSEVILVSSSQLPAASEEENDIPHTYYYLAARQGQGPQPTVGDSVLTRIEGRLLDGTAFESFSDFTWQILPGQIRGYADAFTRINSGTAEGIVGNPDGTTDILDSGIGLMILPSGLGFFNAPTSPLIPAYAPLIFTFESGLIIENTDSDRDGIPNILEDLNGNGFLFDDNTDEADERELRVPFAVDFLDIDDDNDGIRTSEEISIDADGNITFPDSDGDGIPDYRDPDS